MNAFNAAFDVEYAGRVDPGIMARLEEVQTLLMYCPWPMKESRLTISDLLRSYSTRKEGTLSSSPRRRRS